MITNLDQLKHSIRVALMNGCFSHQDHHGDVIMGAIASPASPLFTKPLFRHRSKKTSKFRVIGFCVGNSPGTGEFPAQMASNAENVSI